MALECILVFRKIQFPEREELIRDIQAFVARVRTIQELMACIHTYLSEVRRYLREVIEVNHSPPLFRLATYRAGDVWLAGKIHLHQLVDKLIDHVDRNPQIAVCQRAARVQHRLALLHRWGAGRLEESTDR